jgi:hypothetical protein
VFLRLLFPLLSWLAPDESDIVVVLWGAAMGTVWGALFVLIGVRGTEAHHSDVAAGGRLADGARNILSAQGYCRHTSA